MDDKEVFNPQSGERIAPKKPKKFWKDWRFYVYTIIAVMLAIVSVSSMVTACAAINAGVGQSEPVSSQYKVRHNAQITTTNGGFTGYSFTLNQDWSPTIGVCNWRVYNVDPSTFTLSSEQGGVATSVNSWTTFKSTAVSVYNAYKPTANNALRFLAVWGYMDNKYSAYFSFIPTNAQSLTYEQRAFVKTNWTGTNVSGLRFDGYAYAWLTNDSDPYLISYEQSNVIIIDRSATSAPVSSVTFQDVKSYYREIGYTAGHTAGYSEGHTAGYSEGHTAGYSEGHTAGYAEGYNAGETHAYDTLQTGIAFETYGMYADAKITLVADRTEGSYYYMDLFDYVTDTNIERTVYVLYIQNASNSTWLGYVQDVNASDSSGATYDIGSFTGATSTTDVVFTALMDRDLWEGAYITSFHGHAEAVNNAFWFTGGSYAATQQIYQYGYGEGYDVGRNDGYDLGYDAGVQVGRTQGMNEVEPESLTNTLVAVFQQPFNQLYRFFNFNILGLNVLGIVSGLISVLVVLKVFKKLYK